ncbi:M24 family metallopeptidase [Vallicoccus soli]|uniref:Aminopeptidase P family protein n=1 Tax=Vallicoccus soli TaxID=2339232 RepID=A0A3A3YYD6_9ACTN|nr:aminopeptidase P family protein [Vallicoccus soli]RJK96760.1 aminopeptidase P family protein [Vallicoccus soli]
MHPRRPQPAPPEALAARRDRVRAALPGLGADAALVTRLVDVRYLTGFTGSNGALLVGAGRDVLATDGRYRTQAAEEAPGVELLVQRAVALALAREAARGGRVRVAVDEQHVTVALHRELAGTGVDLVALGPLVQGLRSVKDEHELALLRAACAISTQALEQLLPTVAPGRSERDIALDLESRMLALGAEAVGFPSIVATGPHSAVPHHRPTDRQVARGDLLKIDFGARYGGYHADCTRTVVLGEPAAWQRDLHALVHEAQRAGREALAPGVPVADVDRAARRVVEEAGHGEDFPHGLGHGVGLEIHEAPMMGYDAEARLADRTPVTVEPGVYLAGRGGVRIEDTLVVGATTELLTATTRELLVL